MGGNLFLDVGPKPDGTIPEEQVSILRETVLAMLLDGPIDLYRAEE